jgi:hypothetical protein
MTDFADRAEAKRRAHTITAILALMADGDVDAACALVDSEFPTGGDRWALSHAIGVLIANYVGGVEVNVKPGAATQNIEVAHLVAATVAAAANHDFLGSMHVWQAADPETADRAVADLLSTGAEIMRHHRLAGTN